MKKDFRIYFDGWGFTTITVVIKGRMKPKVFVLPKVPYSVKAFDVETGVVTEWSDLKKYEERGILPNGSLH